MPVKTDNTVTTIAAQTHLQVQRVTPANANSRLAPIIFLHDSLGSIAQWRGFPEKLAAATGREAIVYERQGHGGSAPLPSAKRGPGYLEEQAALLPELMRQLGIAKAVLYGHSDGASIALIAAADFPGLVTGAVLEAPHIFVDDFTRAGIRATLATAEENRLLEKLEKYHGAGAEALFRAWHQTWLSAAYAGWNITPLLRHITAPLLIIQGELDQYGTMQQLTGIRDAVQSTARIELISGIGHAPYKEAPAAVLQLAGSFISGL